MTIQRSANDIKIIQLYNGKKFRKFELIEPVNFVLSSGEILTAPKGFQFDGRSSFILSGLFPKFGKAAKAWLLHDYMYRIDYKAKELGKRRAQKLADKEMLILSQKLNPGSVFNWCYWSNYLSFLAVRIFGAKVYKKNRL